MLISASLPLPLVLLDMFISCSPYLMAAAFVFTCIVNFRKIASKRLPNATLLSSQMFEKLLSESGELEISAKDATTFVSFFFRILPNLFMVYHSPLKHVKAFCCLSLQFVFLCRPFPLYIITRRIDSRDFSILSFRSLRTAPRRVWVFTKLTALRRSIWQLARLRLSPPKHSLRYCAYESNKKYRLLCCSTERLLCPF